MSKKMMLFTLAVAAMLAIPSGASAQEIHISGVSTFSISGPGGTLVANNEPKISCTSTGGSGSFNAGSTTTGSFTLDFTGCSAEFFGIKANCNTSGAAAGTVASGGTFHLITFVNSAKENKPAILATMNTITMICAGFSSITFTGSVIGTFTSPPCGSSSKEATVSFKANGSSPPTQEHELYTGVNYDLQAKTDTENATEVTAGLVGTATLKTATIGTLECT
jgi:hypothetical protein